MHVAYFTERPYRWVPEDVIIRNKAYFAVPNSYFDRSRAADGGSGSRSHNHSISLDRLRARG